VRFGKLNGTANYSADDQGAGGAEIWHGMETVMLELHVFRYILTVAVYS